MAYRGQFSKFGNKTTSQIASLTGMVTGDTVFNTDYGQMEFYTGSVWTNNNSILVTAGATITEGQICQINASGQAVLMTDTPNTNAKLGIGICQYGGTTGQTIVLRTCGIAKCKVYNFSVSLGGYAQFSSVAGAMGSTSSPSIGTFGRILQGATAGTLCYVFLAFIERA